ncbi:MAG: ATP-binding protein [Candidatus Krumholzibacteriota bacterium]|nr:ATP-binding protein [Candidatus Krumholzibacteriota bacterium]
MGAVSGTAEVLRWEIPSLFRWLGVIDAALQEVGQELAWEREELNEVSVAVIEAVSNAIEHGNRFEPARSVQVELRASGRHLRFRVSDEGPGFASDRLDQPTPSPESPEFMMSRGRGLFIMRDIMDAIRIQREAGRFVVELDKELKAPVGTGH